MTICAYGDNIVMLECKQKTSGSLIYVPEEKSNAVTAKVTSSNDESINVDDIIVVDRRDVTEVKINELTYMIVNKKHILAFLVE